MTLGRMDPALAETLVEQSNAAIHWMKDIGIDWELLKEHAKIGKQALFRAWHCHSRRGRRRGPIGASGAASPRRGVSRSASRPRSAPSTANMHHVEGRARLHRGQANMIFAPRAIIACAGGFQANAEMRARYLAGNGRPRKGAGF